MENQTQQVQPQPEQKKRWYKRLKIWVYITIVLFILIVIFALIASKGMPILEDVPSEVTESVLSVNGFGVESNVNVKLYVNGNEEAEVKANKEGKFNAELNLAEGENIIYAVAPYKDKLFESSESKVKYIIEKQEEIEKVEDGGKQEEAKNAELLKEEQRKQEDDRTRTEAERIKKEKEENEKKIAEEAERKKQENIDESIERKLSEIIKKDINEAEITFDNHEGKVGITHQRKFVVDEAYIVRQTWSDFIRIGMEAFDIDGVSEIILTTQIEFTDEYGKKEYKDAVVIGMEKEEFSKYQWSNLEYAPLKEKFQRLNSEYYIHLAMVSKIDWEKVYFELVSLDMDIGI